MTPLYRKLGLEDGQDVYVVNYNDDYLALFGDIPFPVRVRQRKPRFQVPFVHLFVRNVAELERYYAKSKSALAYDGKLWISWPKGQKSSDINRDVIREYGLLHGLVDVKVASIDYYWSGLKFVYRVADRPV